MSDPTTYGSPTPGVQPPPTPATAVTTTIPPVDPEPAPSTSHSPLHELRVEKPRTHPLTYAALAISLLALLLSIAALTRDTNNGYRQVRVGSEHCVIGNDDGADADALFCRTASVPG